MHEFGLRGIGGLRTGHRNEAIVAGRVVGGCRGQYFKPLVRGYILHTCERVLMYSFTLLTRLREESFRTLTELGTILLKSTEGTTGSVNSSTC